MSMAAEIESGVALLRSLRDKNEPLTAVNSALEQITHSLALGYRSAAQRAKSAAGAEEEAAVWAEMSRACSSALAEMKQFKHNWPKTNSASWYDKVLDLKLAAEERKNWAIEERACQSKIPKGLFPATK